MLPQPGQRLSHYRLVEKIGEGGMGVVFLAEDENLKRRVALKVLPPDLAGDPERLERFQREAEAVAALNHPNIVTIYSVEESGGTRFLTMERVEGESLDRMIPPEGFPLAKVFDLAIPLADALSAAHARGVVHRDLKPANVMVSAEGRVKVLDFGLAKLAPGVATATEAAVAEMGPRAPTVMPSLTGVGIVVGTVPYMSPEQLQGKTVDHRTDIFSLGVLLHELATGKRPFGGTGSADLISAIMRDIPAPVNELNASLPRHLGRIISHSLEKDPEQRFQSAKDIRNELNALRRELDSSPSSVTSAEVPHAAAGAVKPPRRWAWVAGSVAALALVVIAFVTMRSLGDAAPGEDATNRSTSLPPTATVSLRPSVAVLGFKNLSRREDAAWLSTALSEMLTTELGLGRELRTIPGENVSQMKRDLSLENAESFSPETLSGIRRHLGSDYVVVGSFLALGEASGGQLRLDMRLQDTAAGETVASLSETATEADLLSLVTRTGKRLREELGAAATTVEQQTALRATLPASAEAARAYTEGVDLLRRHDARGARERLEAAAAAEPDHPLVRAALAEAWSRLGYDARALVEAERAFQHSGDLPDRERQMVEGSYREVQNDWDQAIAIYRSAWRAAPDDLDVGLRLARVQGEGGHGLEALETLAALRELPGKLGGDPRIDLEEVHVAQDLGEYDRSLTVAVRAAKAAESQGQRLLQGEAAWLEGWSEYRLGRLAEAVATGDRALAIYQASGSPAGQANALNLLGSALGAQGDHGGAQERYEQALAIFQDTGNREREGVILNNLANVVSSQGDLAQGLAWMEQSLAITREVNDRQGEGLTLGNLAVFLSDLGDLEAARERHQESLAIAREVGDRAVEAGQLLSLAWLSFLQGNLQAARSGLQQGLELSRETGHKTAVAWALSMLGDLSREEADPEAARRQTRESLEMEMEMGAEGGVAGNRLLLARLDLEQGRGSDAEPPSAEAREIFRRQGNPAGEVRAAGVLARALAAQGKLQEATREIESGENLTGRIHWVEVRLVFGLDAAQVEMAQRRFDPAGRRLEELRREAAERGYLGIELEARLLLGRIALRAGDAVTGRAALVGVEDDARARGFERIARLAAKARG